jgi:hypothetical protein
MADSVAGERREFEHWIDEQLVDLARRDSTRLIHDVPP